MKDCIWCDGENCDGSERFRCRTGTRYRPDVDVGEHICPPCAKLHPDLFHSLELEIDAMCDGAELALRNLFPMKPIEEQINETADNIRKHMFVLAEHYKRFFNNPSDAR